MGRRVVVALFLLALVGCSHSSPKPAPMPSVSTGTASPSASGAPSMPAAAEGTDAAAAKAFAKHYFDVINYATVTGDTAPLLALSDPSCESCQAIAQNIDRAYSAGGRIRSQGWEIRLAAVAPGATARAQALDLQVLQHPETVVASAGHAPKTYPGGRAAMSIHLRHEGAAWHVARLDLVA